MMKDQIDPRPEWQTIPVRPKDSGQSWLKIFGIVVVASVVSTLFAITAVYFYLFPGAFTPVTLSNSEQQTLEQKLERLDSAQRSPALHKERRQPYRDDTLRPERYSEEDASREVILTERELNALLARNTDLATKLAIDLSENLASARLRLPLDEDLPFFGGKTLRVSAGLEMSYRGQRPVVALRGVNLWGVPLPNAWLGNMKNVDLVSEFGDREGFWKSFADGIDEIKISEGQLLVRLKE